MTKSPKTLLILIIALSIGILYWYLRIDINEYFYSKHVVYWNDNVKINYTDFHDNIDYNSDRNITYYHGLYLKSNNVKDAYVRAIFDKNKSWVKDTTKFDYQEEMELQQIRFDLYEVYARKFNTEIDKIRYQKGKCFSDLEQIGDKIYTELNDVESEIYDNNLSMSDKIKVGRPIINSMLNQTDE